VKQPPRRWSVGGGVGADVGNGMVARLAHHNEHLGTNLTDWNFCIDCNYHCDDNLEEISIHRQDERNPKW